MNILARKGAHTGADIEIVVASANGIFVVP